MNRESELSKFKLYYECLLEPDEWRRLKWRTTVQLMREHIQRPIAAVALAMPARVKRRRK